MSVRVRKSFLTGAVWTSVVAVCLSVATVKPAVAEGGFTSFWTTVRVGKETRTWWDANHDQTSTSISHYSRCLGGATSVTYALMGDIPILPDRNLGEKVMPCSKNYSLYWGRVARGTYHFSIHAIANSPEVTVSDVRVAY